MSELGNESESSPLEEHQAELGAMVENNLRSLFRAYIEMSKEPVDDLVVETWLDLFDHIDKQIKKMTIENESETDESVRRAIGLYDERIRQLLKESQ